ncbi:MAG: hypothetical protein ABSB74_05545 [Tepidisphaeraceae bacterium]
MPMIRIAIIVAVVCLAGCASTQPGPGSMGPTGHFGDARYLVALNVRDQWKYDVISLTQELVTKDLRFPKTARFDEKVRYEAYYDSNKDITWLAVYGNVTCSSDFGQVDHNGYYVTWQQPGKAHEDFLPPWKLQDVEVLDQTF